MKMPRLKEHPCARGPKCKPATRQGVLWLVDITDDRAHKVKRIKEWLCDRHLMENDMGLWGYTCTRCLSRQKKALKAGKAAPHGDFVTWVSLDTVLTSKTKPKCPWCSHKMVSV